MLCVFTGKYYKLLTTLVFLSQHVTSFLKLFWTMSFIWPNILSYSYSFIIIICLFLSVEFIL